MRIGILIGDTDYRDALVEKLSSYDNDLFVNVLDGSSKDSPDSLILTDIQPSSLDEKVLLSVRPRTLFLISGVHAKDTDKSCHTVFKYSSITSIVSEIAALYAERSGGRVNSCMARTIAVITENDAYSADKCRALARQIIYRHGGRVMILPMSFINDHGTDDTAGSNGLSRLLYSIRTGRERGSEGYTYTDSYGISSLFIGNGINPVAYLDGDELAGLVSGLASRFDTLILDIGTCFRKENISMISRSDSILCFERGRRVFDPGRISGDDSEKKIIRIKLTDGTDEAHAIDDAVKIIYKAGSDGEIKS